jgi:hypothetical protein
MAAGEGSLENLHHSAPHAVINKKPPEISRGFWFSDANS